MKEFNSAYLQNVVSEIGAERFEEIINAERERRLVIMPCVVIPIIEMRSYKSEFQPCIVNEKLTTYQVCERTLDWEVDAYGKH